MITLSAMPYLTFQETMVRLGYKTRKSLYDLVAAGTLTPVRPKRVRGKHAPRVFFDEAKVNALAAPNPNRLSRMEAAAFLGVPVRTIDRMLADGDLTAYPAPRGSRRRIELERSELEKVKAEWKELGL